MNFEDLFSEHASYIYNYALRLSCNPAAAEDLSQETFLKAWKNRYQLRDQKSVKYWLRKICLNTFLMKIRKQKNNIQLSLDELTDIEREGATLQISTPDPSPEDELLVDESIKEIQNGCFLAMVRKLTLNQRITFSLIDMFGLSMDEVSEVMGLSKSAIKALLYRARMNLDAFFSNHCNLIKISNPCNCKSWVDFCKHRDNIKNQTSKKKLISTLDYTKTNYVFDADVRKKVEFLYANMPERKPSQEWYDNVIRLIGEIYTG